MTDVDRAADLVRVIYAHEDQGFPLHIELDDRNLSHPIRLPDMRVCPDGECGWKHGGRVDHPEPVYHWAVVAAVRELVPLLNRMPEDDRETAVEQAHATPLQGDEREDELEDTLDQTGRPRTPWGAPGF